MSAQQAPAISRTSVYVAAGRAIGAREQDPSVRNPDHLVERLLGDVSALDIDHPTIHALPLPYEVAMQDVEVAKPKPPGDTIRRDVIVVLSDGDDTSSLVTHETSSGR